MTYMCFLCDLTPITFHFTAVTLKRSLSTSHQNWSEAITNHYAWEIWQVEYFPPTLFYHCILFGAIVYVCYFLLWLLHGILILSK